MKTNKISAVGAAEQYLIRLEKGLLDRGMTPNEHYTAVKETLRDFAQQLDKQVTITLNKGEKHE